MPAVAGLRTALTCARRCGSAPGDSAACARSPRPPRGRAARRPDAGPGGDGWLDEIEAKELLRAAGLAVPEGRVVSSEDECAVAVATSSAAPSR